MKKTSIVFVAVMSIASAGCVTDGNQDFGRILSDISDIAGPVTTEEVGAGLREALKIGSSRVVDNLSSQNGYFSDDAIKIKLPGELGKIQRTLGRVGMDGTLNDLELKMNRAAEAAAPKAKTLFVSAVTSMTIDDAMSIFNGGDTAATDYLKSKLSPQLRQEFKPYVVTAMGQVGALEQAETIAGQYLPSEMVSSVRNELVTHAVDGALDGLFYYLAKEEQAIRNDPVKQTTKLLRRVFGG